MRPTKRSPRNPRCRFNPRICKRCDFIYSALFNVTIVSIHASVKDATPQCGAYVGVHKGFNPRICKRCDTGQLSGNLSNPCFNPRICKRCDSAQPRPAYRLLCFNPRICKRCDGKFRTGSKSGFVSIHASVKDATPIQTRRFAPYPGFNPRICKRCDILLSYNASNLLVSIHASVKDATVFKTPLQQLLIVSIHASVKDATLQYFHPRSYQQCFNPRICKRCDKRTVTQIGVNDCFNPRICKRCDPILLLCGALEKMFQSTHL